MNVLRQMAPLIETAAFEDFYGKLRGAGPQTLEYRMFFNFHPGENKMIDLLGGGQLEGAGGNN